nr:hypothetical protein [Sicyoidochytrium minutum DNA virus]
MIFLTAGFHSTADFTAVTNFMKYRKKDGK